MSDYSSHDAKHVQRAEPTNEQQAAAIGGGDLRSRIRWASVLPAAAIAALGAGAVAWLLAASARPVTDNTILALAVTGLGCLAVIAAAFLHAERIASSSERAVAAVQTSLLQGHDDLQRLLEQLRKGERPALGSAPPAPIGDGDPIAALYDAVCRAHHAARAALVQASASSPVAAPGTHVEVFVNLARRLQSLVHRTIQLLDDLENQVEDPDLLKGLFQADHLVTRMRRHAENLAVLGGADSRRQWSTPQAMTEVLRSAIAEVEQYSRVKLVPPVEGTVQGHAVADLIHLVAELVENATVFSPPHTLVLLRAQTVTAGLVIEVEDRGLGISREDQRRLNHLLTDPQKVDVGALLRDGRLGLYVVSVLARRHGMAVQLRTNIFGGTEAIVIVPHALLGAGQQRQAVALAPPAPPAAEVARQPAAVPAVTATPTVAATPAVTATPTVPASPAVPATPAVAATPAVTATPTVTATPAMPAAAAVSTRHGLTGAVAVTPPLTVPADPPDRPGHADQPGRPPLPRRTSQTHLVPELKEPARTTWEEPTGEHDPQLMAAFQDGFRQAGAVNGDDGGGAGSQHHTG